MAKEKGSSKSGGRKAGTPNKVSKAAREVINQIIEDGAPKFRDTMDKIYAEDPPLYAALYIKMLPYVTPKLNSVDIKDTTNVEKSLEQQLAEMAEE